MPEPDPETPTWVANFLTPAAVPVVERDWPTLERYEIEAELGRGGMGVVYRARDRVLKRHVAVKMIRHGAYSTIELIGRFQAEAEAVARLDHPNIVRIFETGSYLGDPFFVLEYVEGGTLAQLVNRQPPTPVEAATLMAALADGVAYAHRQGVVHRDLKPANVLVAVGSRQ